MSFTELPDDVVLDNEQAAPAQPQAAAPQTGGIHFKDAGELAAFRKEYPDKKDLSDADFLDWFGRSRTIPTVATMGAPPPPSGQAGAPHGFSELPDNVQIDSPEPDTSLGHSFGLAGRSIMKGVGQVANVLSLPLKAMDAVDRLILPDSSRGLEDQLLGTDYEKNAGQVADKLGLPTPQSSLEHVFDSAGAGLSSGLATAGLAAPLAASSPLAAGIASTSGAQAIGGVGAGAGAEIAKQEDAGPLGQIGGALAGGLGVSGLASGLTAAGRRIFSSDVPSTLLAAFQRQQVAPMAAQVGGYASKGMTGAAKATLGGIPLAAAAERSIASAKAARDRIAASMGQVMDDTGAGQAVQRGARSFMDTTAAKASKLYDAIPIAGDRQATLGNTRRALADLNAGLPSNPELSAMLSDGRLQRFESALTPTSVKVPDRQLLTGTRTEQRGGTLSWQDLKSFRSYIGELAGRQTLQDSTSKDALQRLYAGLSEDMRTTAQESGPGALKAFTRANSFYAARQNRIENTLKLILGNDLQKSPEAAFGQIDRWARDGGDAARLARTIRSLPPDEANTVRASIFARLGRANPGQQNAAVDAFSPASFGTQWAKLDHRAKSVLFPGAQYRQDLDDIAKIAEAMKASEKFANTSGTAFAERVGKNLLGATVVSYILHPTAAIAGEGVGYGAGTLLGSARFARWLASSPSKPIGPATLAHINRLTAIAQAEPAIANEVLTLQQRLASAIAGHPIAASPVSGQQENNSSAEVP